MAYIDINDYTAAHCESIAADDFDRYAERASEAVDAATGWAIKQAGLDTFGAFDTAQIKLACCLQAEYLYTVGIENALTGTGNGGTGGYVIGQTQIISGAQNADSAMQRVGGALCAAARAALFPTGLLYSGVVTLG